MSNVWVLLVARALIVFGSMGLPATQTHPTEVMLAVAALHVVTAPILLYADVALWTLTGVQHIIIHQGYVKLIMSI